MTTGSIHRANADAPRMRHILRAFNVSRRKDYAVVGGQFHLEFRFLLADM